MGYLFGDEFLSWDDNAVLIKTVTNCGMHGTSLYNQKDSLTIWTPGCFV